MYRNYNFVFILSINTWNFHSQKEDTFVKHPTYLLFSSYFQWYIFYTFRHHFRLVLLAKIYCPEIFPRYPSNTIGTSKQLPFGARRSIDMDKILWNWSPTSHRFETSGLIERFLQGQRNWRRGTCHFWPYRKENRNRQSPPISPLPPKIILDLSSSQVWRNFFKISWNKVLDLPTIKN